MANPGDTIMDPHGRERITWLQTADETGGEYLRFELRAVSGHRVTEPGIHPTQTERFDILAGVFEITIGDEARRYEPGDDVTIPAGAPHAWAVVSEHEGVAIVERRPALRTEDAFESLFGLDQDGLLDERGFPVQPWLALFATAYAADFGYPAELADDLDAFLETQRPIAEEARAQGRSMPYPYPFATARTGEPETIDASLD